MKRISSLFSLILLSVSISFSYEPGNLFLDACVLETSKSKNELPLEAKLILNHYNYVEDSNSYLDMFFRNKTIILNENENRYNTSIKSNLHNSDIDITYYAAGVARYLAERTREELNEVFFRKMKERINEYPELKTLFPNTADILKHIETYSYASILQVLKEAFETDVAALPSSVYAFTQLRESDCPEGNNDCNNRLGHYQNYFSSPDGMALKLALHCVEFGANASNPAQLMNQITISQEVDLLKDSNQANDDTRNLAAILETGHLISQSLLGNSTDRIWVTKEQFSKLVGNDELFRIYLGLLIEKNRKERNITYYNQANQTPLNNILLNPSNFSNIRNLISNLYNAFESTDAAIQKLKAVQTDNNKLPLQQLYIVSQAAVKSYTAIIQSNLIQTIIPSNTATRKYINDYLRPAFGVIYHLQSSSYNSALFDVTRLLFKMNEFYLLDEDKSFNKFITSMNKYGPFIAGMASAQNADEVKAVLKASTLPNGSSSIKRKTNWSIAVNAYVGGYWGKTFTEKTDTLGIIKDSLDSPNKYMTYGIYAPIGISFNKGTRCGLGFSLFTQIIDLGALVNFYLIEGDGTAFPTDFKIRLSNIFAPGVQLGINLPKTPLTVLGGVQFVPALYKKDQISTSSEIISKLAWRAHISLMVDLPMFNFRVWDFNKSKK